MGESQELLRKYLSIPAKDRLKVVEDNLTALIKEMVKEEPAAIGIKLNTPAVLLDLVREIRQIKEHLGITSPEDSTAPPKDEVQSSPVVRVDTLPWTGGIPS